MTYGLYLSTAGLQANQYRMAVAANNLANSDTVGFKEDLAVLRTRPVESTAAGGDARFAHPTLRNLSGGTFVAPTFHTFEQGDLERTDNPLDLAIYGDGFFTVQEGDQVRYTRDGRMTLDESGRLVLVAGRGRFRVLDTSGTPIVLDRSRTGEVVVRGDGTIQQGGQVVGRIGIVRFDDRSQLSKTGGGLYRNGGPVPQAATGTIKSGYVERSTADPVRGLARMIEISRAYQLNANLISLQDQTIGQAVTTVGRIR